MNDTERIAFYEAGADTTPRERTTVPSAGQLWHELLAAPPDRRLAKLGWLLSQNDVACECFALDHRSRIETLTERVAHLEQRFERERRR